MTLSACHREPLWYDLPGAGNTGLEAHHEVLAPSTKRGVEEGGWRDHRDHVRMARRPLLRLCQKILQSMKLRVLFSFLLISEHDRCHVRMACRPLRQHGPKKLQSMKLYIWFSFLLISEQDRGHV